MRIGSAYDAYWFLSEHPKMQCREATLITEVEAKEPQTNGARVRKVKDDMPWCADARYWIREYALYREALSCNLDIFYSRVDARGRVNDDDAQNVNNECWLEFGPIKQVVSEGTLHVQHGHDARLDCGAATFDAALVKLARLVRRHYGDIKSPTWAKRKRKAK